MRLCTIALLFFLATPMLKAQDSLKFLVKPYLQYSTQSGMSVLWETTMPASTFVRYGVAAFNVDEAPLPMIVSDPKLQLMHEVRMEDLKPETNYFWQTISVNEAGDSLISELYSFKTAVNDSSAYAFALVGDTQSNSKTPWGWSVIAQKVWEERPNFVVHAGDVVDWGPDKSDWTGEFFAGGQALMSRIPVFTVLGNHEGDADYYYQYMANPTPEYRYTFKYGNAEFFMIDTNRDVQEGSDQYNWLEQALARSTATWKFAIHHHPPYSSEKDDHGDTYKEASTMGTHARNLVPLYEKYGVDFSLFGHTHVYERTWPLKNNRINQKEGVVYINSGGAGGGLETFAPTRNWFTLELQEGHHYCLFNIFENTLIFKAVDHEGRIFDSFQMTKSADRNATAQVLQPPAPIIGSEKYVFHDQTAVRIDPGFSDLTIHYTTDGSEPGLNSSVYTSPITLKESQTLKARAYTSAGKASRVVSREFLKTPVSPAVAPGATTRGLQYTYYEGDWRNQKQDYFKPANRKGKGSGIVHTISLDDLEEVSPSRWGVVMEGYLEVPRTDTYTFYGLDSRGLEVFLDGKMLINSEDENQLIRQIVLEKGKHRLQIRTYQQSNRRSIGFGFYSEEDFRIPIKPFDLSHITSSQH
ncbi:MAG: metallophosphoesterase [Saprospiraceae bacterium]|nr:metallophosphoesterase [Lewinella sp.]